MAKLIFILSLIFSAMPVYAESLTSDMGCLTAECASLRRKTLTREEIAALPAEIQKKLQRSAEELAQVWGDTILEGDYFTEGEILLDRVEEIYDGETFVAFRITYSAQAWDTSTCDFDSEDLSTLESCAIGRIRESGFVSKDFQEVERDPEALATFQRD